MICFGKHKHREGNDRDAHAWSDMGSEKTSVFLCVYALVGREDADIMQEPKVNHLILTTVWRKTNKQTVNRSWDVPTWFARE